MSDEKRRLVLFALLTFIFITGMPIVMEKMGWAPPKPPAEQAKPAPVANGDPANGDLAAPVLPENVFADDKRPGVAEAPKVAEKPQVEPIEPAELVLGPKSIKEPEGYLLRLKLAQQGAGVTEILSTKYEAEWKDRKNEHLPFALLKRDPKAPPSFALDLVPPDALEPDDADNPQVAAEKKAAAAQYSLDGVLWEVVRDDAGKVVHEAAPRSAGGPKGQEIRFRTTVGKDGPTITRRYRLYPGELEHAFDMIVELECNGQATPIAYRLMGPHAVPIEGEWYTSTFRDLVVAQREADGSTALIKVPGTSDIAKTKDAEQRRFSEHPLAFAGVENQYFAVLVEPRIGPDNPKDGWVASTSPAVIHDDPENHQKADISFELTTKPELVNPGHPETHAYRVFAGPKIYDVLSVYGAQDLASYRKGWQFPIIGQVATYLSKNVIALLLEKIYALTKQVSGGRGNYGIAIILLTMTVRMMLFPLGRKAAIAAKRMQALQPLVSEIKEKHKGDNEKILKEQQALYRRHNVSMFGGCLPAIIQLPIFIGLWQTLNNSVALRHASFLWIQNLAAPDMLFKFPINIPYLGDYFNVLPFVVVGLMLVQNKLFMPPATTPEAEMQQKMMKYMMVFMAFMFYRVPSGLGLYFITSSCWAICERLLLPKVMHTPAAITAEDDDSDGGKGGGPGGKDPVSPRNGGGGWLSKKLEALLEEAAKEKTIRNNGNGVGGGAGAGGGTGGSRGGDRGAGPGKSRSRPRRR